MTSLAEEIAKRTAGSSVQLLHGQIVVADGVATVNLGGRTPTVRWLASWTPTNGDAVLVALQGNEAWVLGKVLAAAPSATDATAPAPVPAPPPASGAGTDTFPAVESRSWRSGRWRSDSDDVLQGTAPGYPGENFGAWFYGAGPASLAGATVLGARVWMRGKSSSSGTPTVHVYRHTSSTRPAGDVARVEGPHDVARDDTAAGWVEIPAGFAQAIVDSGGGIGIAGTPYARITGLSGDGQSGALQIDWQR